MFIHISTYSFRFFRQSCTSFSTSSTSGSIWTVIYSYKKSRSILMIKNFWILSTDILKFRSACSSGAPSRSTSVQTRRPGNSCNSTFISSSSWFWIPRPRDSSVVARLHPRMFTHTLPRCVPVHTHGPHTDHASTDGSSSTPWWPRQPTGPSASMGEHKTSLRCDHWHLGVSPHGGFADLAGFTEAGIRRGEIVDGVRRVDVVIGQVRGKTVSIPEHELEVCGGECAVDRWWQRVSRMNDNKKRLNENPGWLMTKRISMKTLLCCDAHEWKQTLCNNLYELSHQPQHEWWNAKGNDYDSLTCTCFSWEKWQKWRKDVLGHKQTLFFVVLDALVRIHEDDLIDTSNITAKTKTMFAISWLAQACFLWILILRWPSTIILEGHFTESHKYGIMPGQICLVLSKSPCSGIPELVQIGECRNLEAHFQDYQQPRKLGGSFLLFPSAKCPIFQDRIHLHLFFSGNSPSAHASCSKVSSSFWVLVAFTVIGWPWSNKQDHLLCGYGGNDYYCNNQCKACLQMDVPQQLHVGFLSKWRQPRSCTNLGTFFLKVLTGCWIGISSNDIDLEVVHLLKDLFEELSNRTWRIHRSFMMNVAYTTAYPLKTWSSYQLPFPCLSMTICCGHKVALGIIALNDQGQRFQIAEKSISYSLTRICEWSSRLFAKLHQENRFTWTFVLFVIRFPRKSNISCGVNHCVDWHIIALGWVASHQTIVLR